MQLMGLCFLTGQTGQNAQKLGRTNFPDDFLLYGAYDTMQEHNFYTKYLKGVCV